jgi:hypothetical protein
LFLIKPLHHPQPSRIAHLHMPLAAVASALWPISLLVITGYVGGERLGLFSGASASARDRQGAAGPITVRAADDVNRRIRRPVTSRAVGN